MCLLTTCGSIEGASIFHDLENGIMTLDVSFVSPLRLGLLLRPSDVILGDQFWHQDYTGVEDSAEPFYDFGSSVA
jgi:hypothetical protein